MRHYFLKRFLQAIPILFGVSLIVFTIMHAAPGDPFTFMIDPNADPAYAAKMREQFGLDQPYHVQYWNWLKHVLQGDLGYSYRFLRPVADMLGERIGPTLLLTTSAYLLALIIAVPLGVMSATRQYSVFDYTVSAIAFAGISLPSFFTALLGIYFFGVTLELVPLGGMMTPGKDFSIADRLYHLILPMCTLAVRDMTAMTRFTRSSMLEVLRQDYVRTARSKGLPERMVMFKHAFRNGSIPLITLFGLNLPELFSGVLFLEIIFTWPGVGMMAYEAVLNRDYPVIITVNMLLAAMVVVGNLLADYLYAVADPRIRYS